MVANEWMYGLHALEAAISADRTIDKVVVRANMKLPAELFQALRQRDIPVQFVPEAALNRMLPGKAHQGLALRLAAVPYAPLDRVIQYAYSLGEAPLIVVLDGVSDVRNLGAIARSAYGLGAHGLLVCTQDGAAVNGDAMKASAGALMHLPISRTPNLIHALSLLKESGLAVVAVHERAHSPLYRMDLNQPVALLLGDEGRGIRPELLEAATQHGFIPVAGEVGSYNVGVAASLALYEAVRQRLGAK